MNIIYSKKKIVFIILLTLIILTVVIRFQNINSPILESYGFRQTQTAITVQNYINEGVSFINYQTPIFGPPWKVPFEFPTYQLSVYGMVILGIKNIDLAARITNIIYFYISAILLYLICVRFFIKKKVSIIVVLLYLWTPYTIVWSRTALIDYASVTFSLAYLLFFLSWLNKRTIYFFLLVLVTGMLGYLTKVTSMLPAIIILSYYILKEILVKIDIKRLSITSIINFIKNNFIFLILLVSLSLLPVIVGYIWVKYTDLVKAASPNTAWLTSAQLNSWNYGTNEQKLNLLSWTKIFQRINNYFMPYLGVFFILIGFWGIYKYKQQERSYLFLSFFASILTIVVYFNLYFVHDYYLIAISPYICVVLGFGIFHFFSSLFYLKRYWIILVSTFFVLLSFSSQWFGYMKPSYDIHYEGNPIVTLGKYIQSITGETDKLIITDFDWDSSILYYSNRKGFMYRDNIKPEIKFLKENFNIIVTKNDGKYTNLISNWKYNQWIGQEAEYSIFRVSDSPIILEEKTQEKVDKNIWGGISNVLPIEKKIQYGLRKIKYNNLDVVLFQPNAEIHFSNNKPNLVNATVGLLPEAIQKGSNGVTFYWEVEKGNGIWEQLSKVELIPGDNMTPTNNLANINANFEDKNWKTLRLRVDYGRKDDPNYDWAIVRTINFQ